VRITKSVPPPGAKATVQVIDLEGHLDCAKIRGEATAAIPLATAAEKLRRLELLVFITHSFLSQVTYSFFKPVVISRCLGHTQRREARPSWIWVRS